MCDSDERPDHDDQDQTDAGWSWPPGWCLPAPPAVAAGYGQPPPWSFQPPGYYATGPTFHPPSATDLRQQVEEAVQRAVQSVLPTALGASASQPSRSLASAVRPGEPRATGGGPSSQAPPLAVATGATPVPRQTTASDGGPTATFSGPATSPSLLVSTASATTPPIRTPGESMHWDGCIHALY